MPKTKTIAFKIKKINKRKKPLPVTRASGVKKFMRRHELFFRRLGLTVLTLAIMVFVYHYQKTGSYLFKASILETPPPFTGTVFPVDKVPDWTHFTGDKSTLYTNISPDQLTPLPPYDLKKMQVSDTDLKWGKASDDEIRNMKITYPVVYTGGYTMNHQENEGSHPAVDIKMPLGTPVKSIASGRVIKVELIETGFGHHAVIEHRNVPDPDNPTKKTTLYSAFNHMDKIYVKKGQVVQKGEVIGTSGNTGTSTTPHLHFQIDRDTAPFHPYWPFSWTESQQAGLSFFDAVNAGLGLPNVKQHTISPMLYITQYLDYSGSSSGTPQQQDGEIAENNTSASESETETSEQTDTLTPEESEVVTIPVEHEDVSRVDTSLFSFDITGESVGMVNNGITLTATSSSDQLNTMSDEDEVKINVIGNGRVSKNSFRKVDFKNNSIRVIVNSSEKGVVQIEIGKSVFQVNFIEQVQPIASLSIETDGRFHKGQVEVIKVVAMNDQNEPTPAANFSGIISIKSKQGEANFNPETLESKDFKNGVAEVRMLSASDDPIIVRAQNGALIGESETLYIEADNVFRDVSKSDPHYEAIYYLSEKGVISGYADGTYRTKQKVNRVEALKMLMLAFGVEAGPGEELPFKDTDDSAWYASTLATALNKSIVKGYEDGTFKPGSNVNIAEYLKMLYLTGGIQPSTTLTANPYADVPKDAWYAPFAYLTNKQNLLDVVNNRLNAGSDITRGDVAETIYRLKYIQDNNLVTYSK